MSAKSILNGVVHKAPEDVKAMLRANTKALLTWEDITSIARNEWLCWVLDAKKEETRVRRVRIMKENLSLGKRRLCCWVGCQHR